MSIPDKDLFVDLLNSLTICRPNEQSGYYEIIAIPQSLAQDVVDTLVSKEIKLYYKPIDDFNIHSLIHKLKKELELLGHCASDKLIIIILCLFSLLRRNRENPVNLLNQIIAQIHKGSLEQIFILPFPFPKGYSFIFGSFNIAPLDCIKLEYKCNKLKCDYYKKYEKNLQNRGSITRKFYTIYTIDWGFFTNDLQRNLQSNPSFGDMYYLIDTYFMEFGLIQRENFFDTILKEQQLLLALGADYFDEKKLKMIILSDFVSIFSHVGPNKFGWVAPLKVGLFEVDLGAVNKSIPAYNSVLKNEYGFGGFHSNPIFQIINSFSRFLAQAKIHTLEGRNDEGFLYYVIALDLLLGQKDSSNRTITERAAVLTFKKNRRSFKDQKRLVDKIYDCRSRFVHNGDIVNENLIDDVKIICVDILICLLFLQKDTKYHGEDFLKNWLMRIDYLAKALDIDKELNKMDWQSLGIIL